MYDGFPTNLLLSTGGAPAVFIHSDRGVRGVCGRDFGSTSHMSNFE